MADLQELRTKCIERLPRRVRSLLRSGHQLRQRTVPPIAASRQPAFRHANGANSGRDTRRSSNVNVRGSMASPDTRTGWPSMTSSGVHASELALGGSAHVGVVVQGEPCQCLTRGARVPRGIDPHYMVGVCGEQCQHRWRASPVLGGSAPHRGVDVCGEHRQGHPARRSASCWEADHGFGVGGQSPQPQRFGACRVLAGYGTPGSAGVGSSRDQHRAGRTRVGGWVVDDVDVRVLGQQSEQHGGTSRILGQCLALGRVQGVGAFHELSSQHRSGRPFSGAGQHVESGVAAAVCYFGGEMVAAAASLPCSQRGGVGLFARRGGSRCSQRRSGMRERCGCLFAAVGHLLTVATR